MKREKGIPYAEVKEQASLHFSRLGGMLEEFI